MHDLDRTTLETQFNEMFEGEGEGEGEAPFNEGEAMELAAELLTVSSEGELNNFLGDLAKRAWGGAKAFANSAAGKAVLSGLRSVAKQALPTVGGLIGNAVVPGIGGAIGSRLASGVGNLFGLELEGLSGEDREFEVAKQFVNLAGAALQNAAQAAPTANPNVVAKTAIIEAAKTFAPGLVSKLGGAGGAPLAGLGATAGRPSGAHHGRWYRRGNAIVLVGV